MTDMNKLPPKDSNNLWYDFNESEIAIVFVHGVLSDSRSCWLSHGAVQEYWPELISRDPRWPKCSVYLGGYYTAVDSGPYEIRNCAQELFAGLDSTDVHGRPAVMRKSRIVFVCHSTGGIVVRYMLHKEREHFKNKDVGLVLIASPSYGAKWADRLSLIAGFYKSSVGAQLRWGNWSLRELDDNFKNLVYRKQIPNLRGVEAYENHFIIHRRFLPPLKTLVEKETAGRYFGEPELLRNTDHFSSAKPDSLSHPSHDLLTRFILKDFSAQISQSDPDGDSTSFAKSRHASAALPWSTKIEGNKLSHQTVILDRHYAYLITEYNSARAFNSGEIPSSQKTNLFDALTLSSMLFDNILVEQHHVSSIKNIQSEAEQQAFKNLFVHYTLSERIGSSLEDLALEDEIQRDLENSDLINVIRAEYPSKAKDKSLSKEALNYINRTLQRAKHENASVLLTSKRLKIMLSKFRAPSLGQPISETNHFSRKATIRFPTFKKQSFSQLIELHEEFGLNHRRENAWKAIKVHLAEDIKTADHTTTGDLAAPIDIGVRASALNSGTRTATLFSSAPTTETGGFAWTFLHVDE